ncbi:hypothetical protein D3C78_1699750 [compost metagenome]
MHTILLGALDAIFRVSLIKEFSMWWLVIAPARRLAKLVVKAKFQYWVLLVTLRYSQ